MGQRFSDEFQSDRDSAVMAVRHEAPDQSVDLIFHTPNDVCRYRAETFSTKEPETLEWLDTYGGEGAFYDIGANVGLYSIYHALRFSSQVFSFEPSVLNLAQLAKNITLNEVTDRIVIVPIPLTTMNQVAPFRLSSLQEGGALSSFGAEFGHDGQPLVPLMQYDMLGLSLDFMVSSGVLPQPPSIMKIDVDGIEHYVLRGAEKVLSSLSLRSVLIEVDEGFQELAFEVKQRLTAAGLVFKEKRHGRIFDTGEFANTFNQVWVRP
jgi:FkbM family methyltransferase